MLFLSFATTLWLCFDGFRAVWQGASQVDDVRDVAARMIVVRVPVQQATCGSGHQAATARTATKCGFPLNLGHSDFPGVS